MVQFELHVEAYCGSTDCADAQAIGNAIYSQSTSAIRDALNDGSLVANLKASSTEVNALLATAVASGDFDDIVIPILALLVFYPDWESLKTCKNDGKAPFYMKVTGNYFEKSLSACCERFFSWDIYACSGDSLTTPDGWYPSWGNSDVKCLNTTDTSGSNNLPDYIRKDPGQVSTLSR